MKIEIHDFCALKNVEFEINKGISIVAGKNGCGKSQLLMALAHQYGNQTFDGNTYRDITIKNVSIIPKPIKALYRPAVRQYGTPSDNIFTSIAPPSYLRRHNEYYGYTIQLDSRFNSLHNDLSRLFVALYMPENPPVRNDKSWIKIQAAFSKVFNKTIDGVFDDLQGTRIGLVLEDGSITPFHSLSTGELEFLSLIKDLVTEREVDLFLIDEIDAHFHPDLQNQLMEAIRNIIGDRYLLITTHSPSLMLSVDPSNLYYLQKYGDVGDGVNQIIRLTDDLDVMQRISELYVGFVSDIRFSAFISNSKNHEVFSFIGECLKPSHALEEGETGQSDPQNSVLRAVMLGIGDNANIIDYGCGKGRLLSAFNVIDNGTLGKISYIGYDIDNTNEKDFAKVVAKYNLDNKFRTNVSYVTKLDDQRYDICLMANVLHEIGPDRIVDTFNTLFSINNTDAKIIILEALELSIGEEHFVVFDQASIKSMFQRLETAGKISISSSAPQSHGGTPLLEMLITVTEEGCTINQDDVVIALDMVINKCAKKISGLITGTNMDSRQYAFYCHNLAHAQAYRVLLTSDQ